MLKEEKVVNYYVMCNKLKTVIRTGWKDWNVKKDRIESVAEHIFGVQMLAIAMKSEYQYDINLEKLMPLFTIYFFKFCNHFFFRDVPWNAKFHS